jgi:zinc protease
VLVAPKPEIDGIVHGEVDGVPAFWPRKRTGPAAGMLMFRVGQADETLPQRGITHLVEHLALVPSGLPPHGFNGQTGPTTTTFAISGQPRELVEFFATLGASLQSLPSGRTDVERGVLKTEEGERATAASSLWRLRWGPRGFGLLGYDEMGVGHLGADVLQFWADHWFVRQNAVLVLNGPPPRGLHLPLKEGVRKPPPAVGEPIDPMPGSFTQAPSFGFSLVRKRTAAATTAMWLLHERLNRELRHEQGIVYGVGASTMPLDESHRHEVFWTTALDEKLTVAGEAMVAVLSKPGQPMTAEEKKSWASMRRARRSQGKDVPGSTAWAAYLAEASLLGHEPTTLDVLDKEERAVREPQVLEALEEALGSALLALPLDVDPGAIATPLPEYSPAAVTGKVLKPAHGQAEKLILAPDGISAVTDRGPVTVGFSRCEAVMAFDDGARVLIGTDGFAVTYRPEQWKAKPQEVTAAIDDAVGRHKLIPSGERESVVAAEKPSAQWNQAAISVLCGLLVLAAMATAVSALGVITDTSRTASERVVESSKFVGVTALYLIYPLLVIFRKRRANR